MRFSTTAFSSHTAEPIIGPPIRILSVSSDIPPAKSSNSFTDVPIGTITFLGSFTAVPSTVTRFETSGIPVFTKRESVPTLVMFITIQPASLGSFPAGILRPVAE